MTDLELLARVIQCEAGGEGTVGMQAVAGVIMNRVNETQGEYGRYNTIRDVIFAPRQFDCASDVLGGRYNPQNLYNMTPDALHFTIAEWAIGGDRYPEVDNALWFFNPFQAVCPAMFPNNSGTFIARIGDHCFYVPTDAYYLT